MLHQHLIDRALAQVRIERRLAQIKEGCEGGLELRIILMSPGDAVGQPLRQVGHPFLELGDRLFKVLVFRLVVFVKLVEQISDLLLIGQVCFKDLLLALEEDCLFSVFKYRVSERVAELGLLLNLDAQIVAGILRFPEAPMQVEEITQGSIRDDRLTSDFGPFFGNQRPAMRSDRFRKAASERRDEAPLRAPPPAGETNAASRGISESPCATT